MGGGTDPYGSSAHLTPVEPIAPQFGVRGPYHSKNESSRGIRQINVPAAPKTPAIITIAATDPPPTNSVESQLGSGPLSSGGSACARHRIGPEDGHGLAMEEPGPASPLQKAVGARPCGEGQNDGADGAGEHDGGCE